MCMPDLQKPSDDSSMSDDDGVLEEEQSDEDIYHSNSDNESSSDSSLGNWYDLSYIYEAFYCHNELNVHCLIIELSNYLL